MNIALWTIQIILAVPFLAFGVMKLTQNRAGLIEKLPWVESVPQSVVRVIGVAEVAGAIGLVVPGLTDVAPVLTPVAATGLVILMALAAVTHMRRNEPSAVVVNAVLLTAAAFVAWGRYGPYPLG